MVSIVFIWFRKLLNEKWKAEILFYLWTEMLPIDMSYYSTGFIIVKWKVKDFIFMPPNTIYIKPLYISMRILLLKSAILGLMDIAFYINTNLDSVSY